ncbi:MAG: hypothetical protein CMK09_06360 [Ponticaulis sp.]|nr:hypothetical protein [Ponticaulis sp.]|tara:strand:+ start:2481 stop:3059 length:579 start_codon:yes stop_codon:yes gene_type:complete
MRYALIALSMAAFGAGAQAQVLVIGSGLAKECYEAAETMRLGLGDSVEKCTKALNYETMSQNDRMSTLTNRGILYMRNGQYKMAMADYEKALEINDQKGETWLNIGAAHIYQQNYSEAIDALNTAIELGTDDLYAAYYNRAVAAERIGDITSAYWDFRKSAELNPEFEVASRQLERFTVEIDESASTGGKPA